MKNKRATADLFLEIKNFSYRVASPTSLSLRSKENKCKRVQTISKEGDRGARTERVKRRTSEQLIYSRLK